MPVPVPLIAKHTGCPLHVYDQQCACPVTEHLLQVVRVDHGHFMPAHAIKERCTARAAAIGAHQHVRAVRGCIPAVGHLAVAKTCKQAVTHNAVTVADVHAYVRQHVVHHPPYQPAYAGVHALACRVVVRQPVLAQPDGAVVVDKDVSVPLASSHGAGYLYAIGRA